MWKYFLPSNPCAFQLPMILGRNALARELARFSVGLQIRPHPLLPLYQHLESDFNYPQMIIQYLTMKLHTTWHDIQI